MKNTLRKMIGLLTIAALLFTNPITGFAADHSTNANVNSRSPGVMSKDLLTGATNYTQYVPRSTSQIVEKNTSSSFSGLNTITDNSSEIAPLTVFGDAPQRQSITALSTRKQNPYATIAHLSITYPNSSTAQATGFMIGENIMATSGHVVYDASRGGWAETITVTPATYNGDRPFGSTQAIHMTTYTNWINSSDEAYDIAVVKLSSSIGNSTGWLGLHWQTANYASNKTFRLAGYVGSTMWHDQGLLTSQSSSFLQYRIDAISGQSGSPLFYYDSTHGYVAAGIHRGDNSSFNRAVRLNEDSFNLLLNTY